MDIKTSLVSLLSFFEEFKALSGYKINWTMSALMLFNEAAKKGSLSYDIPIKTDMYLDVQIKTSLHSIIKFN